MKVLHARVTCTCHVHVLHARVTCACHVHVLHARVTCTYHVHLLHALVTLKRASPLKCSTVDSVAGYSSAGINYEDEINQKHFTDSIPSSARLCLQAVV